MRLLLNFILLVSFFQIAHSKEAHDHSQHIHKESHTASVKKAGPENLLIKVHGMVCAFCAQGIEKNFNERKEVKNTKVDLDKMEVKISLHKGQNLDEATIKKIITDAGFEFKGITNE